MRWSPQMSSMMLLLTSQLRPLSYRLLPCTSSSALWRGRPAYRCQPYLYVCRGCLAAYVIHSSQCGNARLAEQTAPCPFAQKKAHSDLLCPQRRPKCAWINAPKLPQVTIFTIMSNAMRRPLVARGVGDLGPAKAESPTLFCCPNLFRYFLTYYVTY